MLWWKPRGGRCRDNDAVVLVGAKVYCFDKTGVHVFNTVSLRWRKLPPVMGTVKGGCGRERPSSPYGYPAVLVEDTIIRVGMLYAFIHTHGVLHGNSCV